MKFVVVGPALSGNKGAAAMLESIVQTLTKKYPGSQFTLLSHYPGADAKLNPYKNLRIVKAKPIYLGLVINSLALFYFLLPPIRPLLRKEPAIKAIAEADAVLDAPGITFNDGREKFLLFNIATILPAIFMKRSVIKCAQAIGPFKNRLNRACAKIFLPKMKVIVARGDYTYDNLIGLKLNNVVKGADYAFALEIEATQAKKAAKYLKHSVFKEPGKLVGVTPSNVVKKRFDKTGQDYVKLNVDFINWLIETGYKVAIFPHSIRNSDKPHNNDGPLCGEIYAQIKTKKSCLYLDEEIDSQTLRYILGKCDLLITSRFHGMIAGLSMKVPTLVIGWSHKYAEVLKMFELEKLTFDFKNMTLESLQSAFAEVQKKQ